MEWTARLLVLHLEQSWCCVGSKWFLPLLLRRLQDHLEASLAVTVPETSPRKLPVKRRRDGRACAASDTYRQHLLCDVPALARGKNGKALMRFDGYDESRRRRWVATDVQHTRP